ncbi:MAG: 2-dehydropantoate 2-reductase [Magnetococcales bacterium]|nr:2-dehydropantoate 2-reductase [Magnetococcales bacterium]
MNPQDTPQHDKQPTNSAIPSPPATLLVVGTGAVGGFYGAALARAGVQVSTVHRSDADHVRAHGIRIEGLQGDLHFQPHRVFSRVEEIDTPPDYLLVTLKALPDPPVADIIRPAVGPRTVIILLQNGLGVEEPIQRAFPHNEVITALAFVCLQKIAPGTIRHLCHGKITLGHHPAGITPAVRQLDAWFAAGGVPSHMTETPATARWIKLVWNAAFNPVSVLAGDVTTAEILGVPAGEKLVTRIMQEVIDVAQALGHRFSDTLIEDHLRATRSIPPYHTSMALDHLAGRPLETEVILGAALEAARATSVPTPLLEGVYTLMTLLEKSEKRP